MVIAAVSLALVLSGCQAVADAEVEPPTTIEPEVVAEPVEPEPEPVEPEISLVPCDDQQREAVSQPITAQTEAFIAGDYEGAYQMATPAFRQAVPLGAFEELIRTSYGPLLESTDLQFGDCIIQSSGGAASMDVRFNEGGIDVFGLRYVLQNTEEGWRVDGASALAVVGSGT